jgi:hypothetical protein
MTDRNPPNSANLSETARPTEGPQDFRSRLLAAFPGAYDVLPAEPNDPSGRYDVPAAQRGYSGQQAGSFNLSNAHITTDTPLYTRTKPSDPHWVVRVTKYAKKAADICLWKEHEPMPRSKGKTGPREKKTREEMDPESRTYSALRAKKEMKTKCLMLGVDRLWTNSTRENQTDRNLALKHWAKFIKEVSKHYPEFDFVMVLERQKRGAWHHHYGTNKYYDVRILRQCWAKATGYGIENINVNISPPRTGSRHRRGTIAGYLAKYMGKEANDPTAEQDRKRYSSSRGIAKPEIEYFYIPLSGTNAHTLRIAEKLFRTLIGQKVNRISQIPDSTRTIYFGSNYF